MPSPAKALTALKALSAAVLAAAAALPVHAQWKPTERVTYLIGVAPGGTVDLYARGIRDALESLQLANGQTLVAENKPGAGGALAMQQLKAMNGNAHWLSTFHTGAIAGSVTGLLRADVRDFVPVAMMVEETSLVAVRADSPLSSGVDLVAALKADPTKLRIAVAPALGQNTHMALAKPLKVAGVAPRKVRFVAFKGSAESVTALLGGHVDAVSTAASTVVPFMRNGQLRTLAVSSTQRLGGTLAGVPTWNEQGIKAAMNNFRAVMAPRGTPPAVVRFWEARYAQLAAEEEWKKDLEDNQWIWNFLNSANTLADIKDAAADVDALVSALGLRKAQ